MIEEGNHDVLEVQVAAATEFATAFARDLCAEVLQWQETGVLGEAKRLRELMRLTEAYTGRFTAQAVARSLVADQAMKIVAAQTTPAAPIADRPSDRALARAFWNLTPHGDSEIDAAQVVQLAREIDSNESHAAGASCAPPEPVGEAGSMPGTTAFTMAVFKMSDVPAGTKLYTASAQGDLAKCCREERLSGRTK